MTTAQGPELPGRPTIPQQVADLARRVARRPVPAPEPPGLVDGTAVAGIVQPPDGGLVRYPRPQTLADLEPPPPRDAQTMRRRWVNLLEACKNAMTADLPDPGPGDMANATDAVELAVEAVKHAVALLRVANDGSARPTAPEQAGALLSELGELHTAVAELSSRTNFHLGLLHMSATRGNLIAPPGADPHAEIEAVMRRLTAIEDNAIDSRHCAAAAYELTRRISLSGM